MLDFNDKKKLRTALIAAILVATVFFAVAPDVFSAFGMPRVFSLRSANVVLLYPQGYFVATTSTFLLAFVFIACVLALVASLVARARLGWRRAKVVDESGYFRDPSAIFDFKDPESVLELVFLCNDYAGGLQLGKKLEYLFERFLARLEKSEYADRFILKGGLLVS